MKTIVTHSGPFHADDCFAVAAILLFLGGEEVKVVRTRESSFFYSGDFVVDVGREYDPKRNRFDHHQLGVDPRENGIPYSSIGLVWKEYGEKISKSARAASIVEERLIMPIDASDNGFDLFTSTSKATSPFTVSSVIGSFMPTSTEEKTFDEGFFEALEIAKQVLSREILHAIDQVETEDKFEEAFKIAKDKRIVVLDTPSTSWKKKALEHKEVLFVVHPYDENSFSARTVRKDKDSFEARLSFPDMWAGKEGEEFQMITGVKDAKFCHLKKFVAFANSKEGAVELAEKALALSKDYL